MEDSFTKFFSDFWQINFMNYINELVQNPLRIIFVYGFGRCSFFRLRSFPSILSSLREIIFRMLRQNNCQLRILYSAKLFFFNFF